MDFQFPGIEEIEGIAYKRDKTPQRSQEKHKYAGYYMIPDIGLLII
jgi:hypothetical protein